MFPEGFEAVDFDGAIRILADDRRIVRVLRQTFGDDLIVGARDAMRANDYDSGLGNEVYGFLMDEMMNEAKEVWSGKINRTHDSYGVGVSQYLSVFYVHAVDYDNYGFFTNIEAAKGWIFSNWGGDVEED